MIVAITSITDASYIFVVNKTLIERIILKLFDLHLQGFTNIHF